MKMLVVYDFMTDLLLQIQGQIGYIVCSLKLVHLCVLGVFDCRVKELIQLLL